MERVERVDKQSDEIVDGRGIVLRKVGCDEFEKQGLIDCNACDEFECG